MCLDNGTGRLVGLANYVANPGYTGKPNTPTSISTSDA